MGKNRGVQTWMPPSVAQPAPSSADMTSSTIVSFDPSTQLVFHKTESEGNLEVSPVQDVLKISNLLADQDMLFRVQTTSPLTYRVKPSNGRIPAGESVSIQVVMIAESTKQDKFLIKYVPIPIDTPSNGNFIELFKTVEGGAQEHRLKCQVVSADGAPVAYPSASPAPSQESLAPMATPTPSIPTNAAPAVIMASGSENVEPAPRPVEVNEVSAPVSVPVVEKSIPSVKSAEPIALSTMSTAGSTSTTASPAKPVSKPAGIASLPPLDPRDSKLASLQSRNQELVKQVEDLQKIIAKSGAGGRGAEQQVPPEWIALLNSQTGFPPVLVVLIALFSFLIGLLF